MYITTIMRNSTHHLGFKTWLKTHIVNFSVIHFTKLSGIGQKNPRVLRSVNSQVYDTIFGLESMAKKSPLKRRKTRLICQQPLSATPGSAMDIKNHTFFSKDVGDAV